MAQQDVLDYIRKTPHNSNVNVVKGMLNNSGGGGSEPLIVNVTEDSGGKVADKTFGEIRTAFESGRSILFNSHTFSYPDEEKFETQFVIYVSHSIYDGGCGGTVAVGGGYGAYAYIVEGLTVEAMDSDYPRLGGMD